MATKYNIFSNKLVEFSKKAAILEKDDEFKLINDWRDNRNPKSLQKILDSYRLDILIIIQILRNISVSMKIPKMVSEFRNYGFVFFGSRVSVTRRGS